MARTASSNDDKKKYDKPVYIPKKFAKRLYFPAVHGKSGLQPDESLVINPFGEVIKDTPNDTDYEEEELSDDEDEELIIFDTDAEEDGGEREFPPLFTPEKEVVEEINLVEDEEEEEIDLTRSPTPPTREELERWSRRRQQIRQENRLRQVAAAFSRDCEEEKESEISWNDPAFFEKVFQRGFLGGDPYETETDEEDYIEQWNELNRVIV